MSRQAETLSRVLAAFAADLHTSLPGRVRSYDASAQTAEIELGARRVVPAVDEEDDPDTSEALPILVGVRVVWPRAGQFRIIAPLAVGDGVLVIFPEQSIGPWLATGTAGDPGVATRHGLDGAIAIPGLLWDGAAPSGSAGPMEIGASGGPTITISDSSIEVGGSQTLARAANLNTHLTAIAASLTTLAAALSVTVPYVTGSSGKGALDDSAPIATTITKGA